MEIFLGLVLATSMLSDLTMKLIHRMLVIVTKKCVFFLQRILIFKKLNITNYKSGFKNQTLP